MYNIETSHGHCTLELKGRTLAMTIFGVVDMEMVLRFMLETKIQVSKLPSNHWASLLDLTEWGLHPPEIVEFLKEFEEWAEQNGQLAEAAVVNESVLKVMARNKLIEGTRKFVHQEYFRNKDDAIEWLKVMSLYEE